MGEWIDIQTQNNLKYVFLPESSGAVHLKVRAANDAHIALTNGPFESNPMTEIHIGGWSNTKSIVRRNRDRPDKVTVLTPSILNANEYVSIWITWHKDEVSAGLKGSAPFITYKDPDPHPITHVAVRTGWGANGFWKIKVSPLILRTLSVKPITGGELRWVEKTRDKQLPPDAFVGGYEDGEVLYVARAMHNMSLIPGKYVPSLQCAVIGFGLETFEKDQCEILCGFNAAWVKTNENNIPPHAFAAGVATETNNETLFIGRKRVDHDLIPGKVHCHYKTCYIPYEGRELEMGEYEILVLPEKLPDAVVWRQRQPATTSRPSPVHRRQPRNIEELWMAEPFDGNIAIF